MSDLTTFHLADWTDENDCWAVVELLDNYAQDPMGGGQPLNQFTRDNLAATMAATPGAFSVIGNRGSKPIALANCFTSLSTFACKPLINIHDLAVISEARRAGVGQQLLAFVEKEAIARGCCKLTLEVLTGNARARRSYERFGFAAYVLDETTGHALFLQKTLPEPNSTR